MIDEQFARDIAVMAVVLGVAAFAWFGWAQEDPPRRWRLPLGAGSGLGLLIAVIGGLLAWRLWGPDSVLADADTRRTFGIVCGIEFGLAGLGSAALAITKRSQWISCWIAFVVGVHFVPLAFIFNNPGLIGLAVVMVIAAGLGVMLHRRSTVTPSAVTGLVSGAGLLVLAAVELAKALTRI